MGRGHERGNFPECVSSGATSQPQIQPIGVIETSLENGQSSNQIQRPLQTEQISSGHVQRISLETQSSRNLDGSVRLSLETESGAVSHNNRKRGRGKYKSRTVDIQTKYGGKIKIMIPDDIDRAVGSGARDIVNYSGLIMRSTVSFRDGDWQKIILKHGEAMWYRVRDKFEVRVGLPEHKLQGFVITTMRKLFRAWKSRLRVIYSSYSTDKDRLSHLPDDVQAEDWEYLVEHFGSDKFKVVSERNKRNREKQITKHSCGTRSFAEVEESTRNSLTGEKETPYKIWDLQHTRKNVTGERVWLDPQSQQIHGQLQQLVLEQQSEEIEHPMTRDEILSSVLGERSGYVQGKGYGKKPPKKTQIQQVDIEASVSSAMESMRQEMQLDMEKKLQEEREQMAADLKRDMERDLQRKLEEEREHMKGEVDKMFQEKMVALMPGLHQGRQGS